MGETKIPWTHLPRPDGSLMPGYSFNPWIGCCEDGPECRNCYAREFATGRMQLTVWGKSAPRHATADSTWKLPLTWNRRAAAAGEWHAVFCASLADVFEGTESCSDPAAYQVIENGRARLWKLIEQTPNLIWQLLTKRPQNIERFVPAAWLMPGGWPQNVWLGTTAGTQAGADRRVAQLVAVRAAVPVRFISCEPCLEYVDFRRWIGGCKDPKCPCGQAFEPRVNWVIVGGESGPRSRICRTEHLSAIVGDCKRSSVPVFVKQIGDRPAFDYYTEDRELCEWSGVEDGDDAAHTVLVPVGDRRGDYAEWSHRFDGQPAPGSLVEVRGRGRKGGNPDHWPESLRVREFPTTEAQR